MSFFYGISHVLAESIFTATDENGLWGGSRLSEVLFNMKKIINEIRAGLHDQQIKA